MASNLRDTSDCYKCPRCSEYVYYKYFTQHQIDHDKEMKEILNGLHPALEALSEL